MCGSIEETAKKFLLDEKDPFNRFDGLFDGRTYGDGSFVLINGNEEDNVYKKIGKDITGQTFEFYQLNKHIRYLFTEKDLKEGLLSIYDIHHLVGNLHENPELCEKITCL